MKDYFIGYNNVDFSFNLDFTVTNSTSGFLFQIGQTGEIFKPVISFSGNSGYIFDQVGDMIGGYISYVPQSISGNYFYSAPNNQESSGRLAFFMNQKLVANNVTATGFFDCIRFEKYNDDVFYAFSFQKNTGDINSLNDSGAFYLKSNNGEFLFTK